jgi:hypothetical protein
VQIHEVEDVAGETPATATGKSEQIRDAPLAVLVALPKRATATEMERLVLAVDLMT